MLSNYRVLQDAEALRNFFVHKIAAFWEKMTDKYLFYSSTDPVVKKSTFEYYPLLKQVFLSHAATDSKVSVTYVFHNLVIAHMLQIFRCSRW